MTPEDEMELAVRRARDDGYALAAKRLRANLLPLLSMEPPNVGRSGWQTAMIWVETALNSFDGEPL